MLEVTISSTFAGALSEFIMLAREHFFRAIYRGQADGSLSLVPKAGRPQFYRQMSVFGEEDGSESPPHLYLEDLETFDQWRHEAIAVTKDLPANSFECLAYAQHYGLATRLLDWTDNPLVALYFAVERDDDKQGSVFIHYPKRSIEIGTSTFAEIDSVSVLTVRPFDRRLQAQAGCFTYHPDPRKPLPLEGPFEVDNSKVVAKINIPRLFKSTLRDDLARLGFSRKALFPDLDGLSDFYNWRAATGLTEANFEKSRNIVDDFLKATDAEQE